MLGPAHKTVSSCSLSLEACCIKMFFTTMNHKCLLQDKNPFETNCQSVWVFDDCLLTHLSQKNNSLLAFSEVHRATLLHPHCLSMSWASPWVQTGPLPLSALLTAQLSSRSLILTSGIIQNVTSHGFIYKWWLAPSLVSTSLRWTGGPAALRLPLR